MIATSSNRYTFEVSPRSTKGQIRSIVEDTFNVVVTKISTVKIAGKRKRVGRLRREIRRPDKKKAIVELKKGQTIDIFETQG